MSRDATSAVVRPPEKDCRQQPEQRRREAGIAGKSWRRLMTEVGYKTATDDDELLKTYFLKLYQNIVTCSKMATLTPSPFFLLECIQLCGEKYSSSVCFSKYRFNVTSRSIINP